MLVALIVPSMRVAFVHEEWGSPPGCKDYRFLPVEDMSVEFTGPHHQKFRIVSDEQVSYLECPLNASVTWTTDKPTDPPMVLSSTVKNCTSCGEEHEVETTILRRGVGMMEFQGVAKCPNTGETLWLRPVLGEPDDGVI